MKLFNCAKCGNILYFENVTCNRCESTLGFLTDRLSLVALVPLDNGLWQPVGDEHSYRMCANYADQGVCNWMVDADSPHAFCTACNLNGTIPDLSVAGNRQLWHTMETEKRRLVASLLQLGLPVVPLHLDPSGLEFDFLADTQPSFSEREKVMTGHDQGLITINIAEADPVERERMREKLDEPYRTILGHFRHESGHYYWDRLIRDSQWLESYRELFGDENLDYGQALDSHYQNGPPVDWHSQYVSAYASAHPWEDWAESWAHYLHIVDALETAYQYGLSIRPRAGTDDSLVSRHDFDAYLEPSFDIIIAHWLPLTSVMNSLNRSIGHDHAYPFVLSSAAVEKLRYVHNVIREVSPISPPE
jgi:hypothetical protein